MQYNDTCATAKRFRSIYFETGVYDHVRLSIDHGTNGEIIPIVFAQACPVLEEYLQLLFRTDVAGDRRTVMRFPFLHEGKPCDSS